MNVGLLRHSESSYFLLDYSMALCRSAARAGQTTN